MGEDKFTREIDDGMVLSELFISIWRHKVLIIALILIGMAVSALISLFGQKPVYVSKFSMTINMPKTYMTRYGLYELPAMSSEQYASLIRNSYVLDNTSKDLKPDYDLSATDINNMLSINPQTNDITSFDVKVIAGDPELACMAAQALYDSFVEYVDIVVREAALKYYADFFSTGLESTTINLEQEKEDLKDYEELLAKTPKFISVEELQGSLAGNDRYLIVDNVINPGYVKLETDIMAKRLNICTLENTLNKYNGNISKINEEKDAIAQYYETGETGPIESSVINVVQRSISLTSLPSQGIRTSSSHVKNIIFGALVGAVLGLSIVIAKGWLKKAQESR